MPKISTLHYITHDIEHKTHEELITEACEAGVEWIQLRVKNKSKEAKTAIAFKAKEICDTHGCKLIINDDVDIALAVKAAGVHLGKEDMPSEEARLLLGESVIIGATANTFEDILTLSKTSGSYIGLGPFRFTNTKENLSPVLGEEGIRKICKQCEAAGIQLPIIAIGGITLNDIPHLIKTGISGVAIASDITHAENKKQRVLDIQKYLPTKQVLNI
jgi:thiamine-phosphate pyrophosphorylase